MHLGAIYKPLTHASWPADRRPQNTGASPHAGKAEDSRKLLAASWGSFIREVALERLQTPASLAEVMMQA